MQQFRKFFWAKQVDYPHPNILVSIPKFPLSHHNNAPAKIWILATPNDQLNIYIYNFLKLTELEWKDRLESFWKFKDLIFQIKSIRVFDLRPKFRGVCLIFLTE